MAEYTPMQQRILAILADGLRHPVGEMATALDVDRKVLRVHVTQLRKRMPLGYAIICETGAGLKTYYRHVRLLASANE